MKPKVRYVPRWQAQELTLEAGSIEFASPTLFANNEVWPMQLHWLSITGNSPESDPSGGIGAQLRWELALSQEGDINAVSGLTPLIFGANSYKNQMHGIVDDAIQFRFPMEYELAPDSGLVASVKNLDPTYTLNYPTIAANGVTDHGHGRYEPATLLGMFEGSLPATPPATVNIESADLFNNGKSSIFLKEMMLKPGQLRQDDSDNTLFRPEFTKTAWRVNPNNDVPWMPQDELIPAGNIAPFNRGTRDVYDEGPKAYVFPTGTKLEPRQRLNVKVESIDETSGPDVTFTLCMFGLLEVQ